MREMKIFVISFVYYATENDGVGIIHTLDIIKASSEKVAIKMSKKNHKHDIKNHKYLDLIIREL